MDGQRWRIKEEQQEEKRGEGVYIGGVCGSASSRGITQGVGGLRARIYGDNNDELEVYSTRIVDALAITVFWYKQIQW